MLYFKRFFITCVMLAALSACQTISVRELSEITQPELDRIEIGSPSSRNEQIFYRQLRDNFAQNDALRDYRLTIQLSQSNSSTLSVKGKSSNLSKTVMTLTYQLEDRVSGDLVTNGNLSATSTSGTVSSYYGQDKSKQFAAERLTKQLADKLTLSLRNYFLITHNEAQSQ